MRTTFLLAAILALTTILPAQQLCGEPVDAKLLTVPEASEWQKTSTSSDVTGFLETLHEAFPGTFSTQTFGKTLQGRAMQVVEVSRKAKPAGSERMRALILANIHGGEIEGKEVVQVLLRELCLGGHQDILAAFDLWFVPIFNVDGNDEIHASNRTSQNGPLGVGKRSNSQSLDLNRDFVKIKSPEARALLGLINKVDPHVFMDLHTTNGSAHGYHLTYSPSLSTNLDPDLDDFTHDEFIPAVREAMVKKHGFRIFDYGNFPRRSGDEPTSWTTYDHKPRLVFNYFGLRNRLSVLSEAYSYMPFEKRALVTRAFVLEVLRETTRRKSEFLALCAKADREVLRGAAEFGYASQLREHIRGEVLLGELEKVDLPNGLGRRSVRKPGSRGVEMDVRVRFEAKKKLHHPRAWAIVDAPVAVRMALLVHGIEVEELVEPVKVKAEAFRITSAKKQKYRYEGHQAIGLAGKLEPMDYELPKGTLIVRARQRLGRIAAQLLEGLSEDSLATWNYFDDQIVIGEATEEQSLLYPVLRLPKMPAMQMRTLRVEDQDQSVTGPYEALPENPPEGMPIATIVCTDLGRRIVGGAFERRVRWEGRVVKWTLNGTEVKDLSALGLSAAMIIILSYDTSTRLANPSLREHCILQAGPAVTNREIVAAAKALIQGGMTKVYLDRKPE